MQQAVKAFARFIPKSPKCFPEANHPPESDALSLDAAGDVSLASKINDEKPQSSPRKRYVSFINLIIYKRMKAYIILLLVGLWLPTQAQTDAKPASERLVFTVVEQRPEFPGGMEKLAQYLDQNLRYPEAARNAKRKGRVFVTFIITDEGAIQDAHVLKSIDPELDAEAVRLVSSMPNWIPGKQAGRPVNVRFNLPIHFKL
ncbi:energy transducer TonB [Spirosoma soli]|uniref:Energy transducer TonB n=1 Tax=Spirosoma soli TaxID=1770529 RepID=A0ABW5M7W4_9BACT